MSRRPREHPLPGAVIGLLILGAGVAFLLDQMGLADAGEVLEWWPAGLVVIGLAHLPSRRIGSAAAWIVAGAVFLWPRFGLPGLDVGMIFGLWPMMIAFAGAALMAQALRPAPKDVFGARGQTFRALAFMGGNERSVGSRDFIGGDAVAVMGGCELDLTHASMQGSEATIDVLAFWGGIEIRVPRNWEVVGRVTPLLGSLDDRTADPPEGSPRLIVRGSAIMGAVEVRNG